MSGLGPLEVFVESTLAAAVVRVERVERRLNDANGSPLSPTELGQAQASLLVAVEHIRSAMRLLDIPAPAKDDAPALRLVRP